MMDCFDSRLLLNESQKRSPTRRVFRSPRYSVTQQGCHASFRDNRPQNAIPTTSLAAKPIASAGLTDGNSVSANVLSQFNTRLQFNNQDRNIAPAVQPNRSLANRRGCPHLVSHFDMLRRGARLKILPIYVNFAGGRGCQGRVHGSFQPPLIHIKQCITQVSTSWKTRNQVVHSNWPEFAGMCHIRIANGLRKLTCR